MRRFRATHRSREHQNGGLEKSQSPLLEKRTGAFSKIFQLDTSTANNCGGMTIVATDTVGNTVERALMQTESGSHFDQQPTLRVSKQLR